jgi:agmatine deiminase
MTRLRMPAEWEPHRATWISWPFLEFDFPYKVEAIRWVYVEIIRWLSQSEIVEIVCRDEFLRDNAAWHLKISGISTSNIRFHIFPIDRTWVRDSGPTAVYTCEEEGSSETPLWIKWNFNAWAKYDDSSSDNNVYKIFEKVSGYNVLTALREDTDNPFVMEGGALEVDGKGTLMTTEQCLLSSTQQRNPGLNKSSYEKLFKKYLGIENIIWLAGSCEGDDTNGHIDDVARFVGNNKILLSYEADKNDPNHEYSSQNFEILQGARDSYGKSYEVVKLPMPSKLIFDDYRLPASYANFYIGNSVVLVPTFNDPNDTIALNIIKNYFPDRKVVGIHAVDLVLGYGTLHCLSQQEPVCNSSSLL